LRITAPLQRIIREYLLGTSTATVKKCKRATCKNNHPWYHILYFEGLPHIMPYSDSKYVLPQTLGILRLVAKTAMATVYTYTHTHTHTTTHTTHTHTTHKQTHTHYTHPDTHYAHTHTHTLHTHTHTHIHTRVPFFPCCLVGFFVLRVFPATVWETVVRPLLTRHLRGFFHYISHKTEHITFVWHCTRITVCVLLFPKCK